MIFKFVKLPIPAPCQE
ncbi:hypothetical protein [Neobacillus soli]